ncbi:MAG: tyrosine-type recombinase/integrase [Coriobacteriales bacterium]|nr:tyrosine-type recombinase/integrase [Coriobacteriales bacterium]
MSVHELRHTHASLLLNSGASVLSVSHRLGHSNITTTQKVYLHVVQELENQDVDVMMRAMSSL